MLGLGNSLTAGSYIAPTLRQTYRSDFTSDNDGWSGASIEGGSLTQTFNQTIGGSDGWMKNVYPANQTNTSGLLKNVLVGATDQVGDFVTIQFKIYLDGNWDGSDNVSGFIINSIASNIILDIPQDEVVQVDVTSDPSPDAGYSNSIQLLFNTAGDRPQSGAIFYIKDIEIDLWNYSV